MTHWSDGFAETACDAGIKEARQYATFREWWEGTQRGDYMLWLIGKVGYGDQRVLRLLAVRFVRETTLSDGRTAWDLLEDERSRQAVIVAERYANGEASGGELRAAREAAWEVARTAAQVAEMAWGAAARTAVWATVWAWGAAEWAAASSAASAAIWTTGWAAVWATVWAVERAAVWGGAKAEAEAAETRAVAQHAVIIREMIPASEIEPLVNQYIGERR